MPVYSTYDLILKIGGELFSELAIQGATAAEIRVLQQIHGEDAVKHIVKVGSITTNSSEIYAQLRAKFDIDEENSPVDRVFFRGSNIQRDLPASMLFTIASKANEDALKQKAIEEYKDKLRAQGIAVPDDDDLEGDGDGDDDDIPDDDEIPLPVPVKARRVVGADDVDAVLG